MPFIHTSFGEGQSARPKATTLYVYNMSLFLVACLLNRWQRASSARCLQIKARGLTTPRSSKPPFPDSAEVIATENEVSQRCALRQHSCKTLCPGCSNAIVLEIEVSQRSALPQHSCKALCPVWSDVIFTEIKVHQRSALRQHSSCKPLCMWSCNCTSAQFECGVVAPG